jgi:hypothetical protein
MFAFEPGSALAGAKVVVVVAIASSGERLSWIVVDRHTERPERTGAGRLG